MTSVESADDLARSLGTFFSEHLPVVASPKLANIAKSGSPSTSRARYADGYFLPALSAAAFSVARAPARMSCRA
jgi:hypothetical protein